MDLALTNTSDGSFTIYSKRFNETYHSVNGSITESNHVFIDAAYNKSESNPCYVLEIGFGTGLNAFLTFLLAEKSKKTTYYHTLERFPVPFEIVNHLNYTEILNIDAKEKFTELHKSDWNREIKISEYFYFCKFLEDINNYEFGTDIYNVVYFDAFSPANHPEAWTPIIFNKLCRAMKQGGVITTYCAKGEVRRIMQSAGFKVFRLPGPPGKREMLKGIKE